MKLLTCEFEGKTFAAVSDGERVYEAAADMHELIGKLQKVSAAELAVGAGVPLSGVKVLSPIPEPRQDVMCLGMNYNDHSAEAARWGKENFVKNEGKAVYFGKRAAFIIGSGDDIDGHFDIVEELDYEVELAVVLGKDAYRVSYDDVQDYVLGYSVLNDISARNLQKDHKQYYFGKSLDTHTAMGPWIVLKDELPWPPEFDIRCYINGEKRQDSNTRNMIFDVSYVVSELSKGMTLKAGTIIATGTPAGVGMGFVPPKYLEAGDVVRCEIDGIGTLENKVK
ncbi:MAG: fumarylacetoacetate hydrolase family protein [Clostridia bacterium]|nr:fumarylacetoacetate hydrolase family protein [Clostridia bacterium]NCC68810.1 fumarylacetoacetate hydrolase family protein [Clostridia bacterium]